MSLVGRIGLGVAIWAIGLLTVEAANCTAQQRRGAELLFFVLGVMIILGG